jgi:TPR repeat protein
MMLLGFLYRDGHGVPQDFLKAQEWFDKARGLGAKGSP